MDGGSCTGLVSATPEGVDVPRASLSRERSYRRLEWIAHAAKGASLRLAERIGFVPTRMLHDDIENRDGSLADAVLAVMREVP